MSVGNHEKKEKRYSLLPASKFNSLLGCGNPISEERSVSGWVGVCDGLDLHGATARNLLLWGLLLSLQTRVSELGPRNMTYHSKSTNTTACKSKKQKDMCHLSIICPTHHTSHQRTSHSTPTKDKVQIATKLCRLTYSGGSSWGSGRSSSGGSGRSGSSSLLLGSSLGLGSSLCPT